MRPWATLGVGLLAGLLVGCVPAQVKTTAWYRGRQPFPAPTGPNIVEMEVALLECPVGDPYINRDLWTLADEQIIPPEQKAALEENGFRVGQVGGIVPAELQNLLTSERNNVNPRRRLVMVGQPAAFDLGSKVPTLHFTRMEAGTPAEVEFAGARCQLVVVPGLTPDGKAKFHFTPQVEYGDPVRTIKPAPEGFQLEVESPHQSYPALSWEVTLGANQYLVIGARFEQRQSLGFASFVQRDESNPVQRLLVIRTNRSGSGVSGGGADEGAEEEATAHRSPPLALQAQTPWSVARSCQP
jgi:hypothetical protein